MSGLRPSASTFFTDFPREIARILRCVSARALAPARIRRKESGQTLLELIVTCSILVILATVAIPLGRATLVRNRETKLHYDLREMRDAIDRYKDAADK